jgi:hypothetical protein
VKESEVGRKEGRKERKEKGTVRRRVRKNGNK